VTEVAIVHDYLTQRGGAERVVLAMSDAFPDAPIYTSLYDARGTFPEFAGRDVRTAWLDRARPLRRRHRLALPLFAASFSSLRVDADTVLCSTSGWAHGARTAGRKIVYCHSPAKWLYRPEQYLASPFAARLARGAAVRPLRSWDRRAARTADVYLANSTAIAAEVRDAYGIGAEVLAPPAGLDAGGAQTPVEGIAPGYVLCVSRLLPYKNVESVLAAFARLPGERLVVVGSGPGAGSLAAAAPANARLLSDVSDAQLRWLYANAAGLVAAAYEDFGLTPVEAASFGKPTAALRRGGYLDTVVEGRTGVFFELPRAEEIAHAVAALRAASFDAERVRAHAARFSQERFAARLRELAGA
jgi:glycosyltransferase involved in cell wall biosynthesis